MSSRSRRKKSSAKTRRFAARLAAAQAIYQHFAVATPQARLLHEFHDHRLGGAIEGVTYPPADTALFDDIVAGVLARRAELDELIGRFLAEGWSVGRLDKLMHAILSAGAYELVARADVPRVTVVTEYVHVAGAFYGQQETGFVNALLDRMSRQVRQGPESGTAEEEDDELDAATETEA